MHRPFLFPAVAQLIGTTACFLAFLAVVAGLAFGLVQIDGLLTPIRVEARR